MFWTFSVLCLTEGMVNLRVVHQELVHQNLGQNIGDRQLSIYRSTEKNKNRNEAWKYKSQVNSNLSCNSQHIHTTLHQKCN